MRYANGGVKFTASVDRDSGHRYCTCSYEICYLDITFTHFVLIICILSRSIVHVVNFVLYFESEIRLGWCCYVLDWFECSENFLIILVSLKGGCSTVRRLLLLYMIMLQR